MSDIEQFPFPDMATYELEANQVIRMVQHLDCLISARREDEACNVRDWCYELSEAFPEKSFDFTNDDENDNSLLCEIIDSVVFEGYSVDCLKQIILNSFCTKWRKYINAGGSEEVRTFCVSALASIVGYGIGERLKKLMCSCQIGERHYRVNSYDLEKSLWELEESLIEHRIYFEEVPHKIYRDAIVEMTLAKLAPEICMRNIFEFL